MQTTIKRTYNVNRLVQIEALTGMVFQAESGGHLFQISGIDNAGEAVALAGTVSGVFLRPDNTDVALSGSVSGGVVSVPLKAECYAVPGRFGLTLYISAGGNKTAIYAAMGTVSRTSSGQVAPTVTADVVDLVNRIAAAVATIPASYTDLMGSIASDYSDSSTYPKVGTFVWYSGTLYRSKVPITTAESWTPAHWVNAILGDNLNDDIASLKSTISRFYGVPKNFELTTTASASRQFEYDFHAGSDYLITNGTDANITMQTRLTKSGAAVENVLGSGLAPHNIFLFHCTVDAYWFNSWCPYTGTITILEIVHSVSNLEDACNIARVSFHVNTEHSSDRDRISVNIIAGQCFYTSVVMSVSNISSRCYVSYSDGTTGNFLPNTIQIASKDITSIGLYVNNSSGTPAVVDFYVFDAQMLNNIRDLQYLSRSSKIEILLGNNLYPTFDGVKVILPGSDLYVVGSTMSNDNRRLRKSYVDIQTELNDYAVITDNGLEITMPTTGVLGFDVATNTFKMYVGDLNIGYYPVTFAPLFVRYYQSVWGALANRNIYKALTDYVPSDTILLNSFNSSFHTGATDFVTKCTEFSSLLLGDSMNDIEAPTDFESFLFFTDPHLLQFENWEKRCTEFICQIQKYYNSTPTTFCLCGGDWTNADLPNNACFKLGYIDGFMHSMFDNCYMVVGNHDTNYQGKKDSESEPYTTKLTPQSRKDLWYRKGEPYFTFDGAKTRFYCFDTDVEAAQLTSYGNYGWNQAKWFAESLQSDNSPHIAVAMHILYYNYNEADLSAGIQPLAKQVMQIAEAYNGRTTITVNGTNYDFTSSTGKVEFCIAGHTHQDMNGIMYGIPWVVSLNVRHNETVGASFDLCLADYEKRLLKMIRVGDGDNRTVSLVTGQLVD